MLHFRTEVSPVTGAREDYYWDDMEKRLVCRKRHDVTDILEANKRDANATIDQRHGNGMMHHVADIPMSLVVKWKQELGVDVLSNDPEQKRKVRKLLNDPEYRYLRTRISKL